MSPEHSSSQGKWVAFEAIGYDLQNPVHRHLSCHNVISQLKQQLATTEAIQGQVSKYGLRFRVKVSIQGPNGKQGDLQTIWQIDNGSEAPRLITTWLEVYQ